MASTDSSSDWAQLLAELCPWEMTFPATSPSFQSCPGCALLGKGLTFHSGETVPLNLCSRVGVGARLGFF